MLTHVTVRSETTDRVYTEDCFFKIQNDIKRHAFESVLMKYMHVKPIAQSEVSQKEENKYHFFNIYTWDLERWY